MTDTTTTPDTPKETTMPTNKATPLGLLGADAIVYVGQFTITGQPAALRALADDCQEAAAMAEAYDADPDAWNERERAERALND